MSEIHIALTGHRPDKLDGYGLDTPFYHRLHDYLVSIIVDHLDRYDVVWVHSGMALGADTVWAFAAHSAARTYPDRVKLHAEIPVMSQPDIWRNPLDRKYWRYLVNFAADKTVYADKYAPRVMQDRNIGMIDHADLLLAVWDGTPGGTGNAVHYAQRIGENTQYIDPAQFR